jgi:Fe-S-cluster containining protein
MIQKNTLLTDSGIPVLFPSGIMYECLSCGQCCAMGWTVTVDPITYENLKKTDFYQEHIKTGSNAKFFTINRDTGECIINNPLGRCSMLKDNLCKIHSNLSYDAKPLGCRQFPIYMYPTPEGIYVGLGHTCISILINQGRPIETYLRNINKWVNDYPVKLPDNLQIKINHNLSTDWQGYSVIENFFYNCLENIKPDAEFGSLLWKAMMSVFMLSSTCAEKGQQQINADEIKTLFSSIPDFPISRDIEHINRVFDYSKFFISRFETNSHEYSGKVFDSLIQNGAFNSNIFGRSFDLDMMNKYKMENPAQWKNSEMSSYFSHMIWRKDLLMKSDLLSGIALMNLMYPFFEWYFYLSALSREVQHPEVSDAKYAVSILERNIKHDHTKEPELQAKRFWSSLNILPAPSVKA